MMVWRSDRARNIYNASSGSGGDVLASGESSEGEFVEEEKPWPPPTQAREGRCRVQKQTVRTPRPHSHLFRLSGGRARGSKHARRWENSMFLTSLHQIPEEEIEEAASILPPHNSPFSKLHNSDKHMQMWCSFSSWSEEEQWRLVKPLNHGNNQGTDNEVSREQEGTAPPTPEHSFQRIECRIRRLLQHNRHLPLDVIASLEEEMWFMFSIDPHIVMLILQTNQFWRLLLHGVCQYSGLQSLTQHCGGSSVVVVESKGGHFIPPDVPLSAFLHSKSRSKSNSTN